MLGKEILFLISIVVFSAFAPQAHAEENSEPIILEINKEEYHLGEQITINGIVSEKKMPVIAIRVYDPEGGIISANSIEIKDDGTFSKSFFLDRPFYEMIGKYKISADYGKENHEIKFSMLNESNQESQILDIQVPEITFLTTDKNEYLNGEFVTINGKVSEISSPTVLIGLYDPFGTPAGFYFGAIDTNFEFSSSFLIKDGVNFKTLGTYSAIGYYEESEISIEFDYVEGTEIIETEIVEETIVHMPQVEEEFEIEELEVEELEEDKTEIIQEITIIENKKENTDSKKSQTNSIEEIIPTKINSEYRPQIKENNLSVKDVALGIMLNQITLNCDDNEYVDSISYYDGMGPALMRLCNFNEAINHFDLALVNDPKNIQVLTNKGSALSKLGYYDEAISFFDYALEINPNFLPAINNKANTLVNLGSIEDAEKNYNLILNLDPQFTLAKQNLNLLQEQFPNNPEFSIYEEPIDISLDSINHITNKVADSTVDTVNKINQNPSNVFEQIGVVFSMIGTTFFNFLE